MQGDKKKTRQENNPNACTGPCVFYKNNKDFMCIIYHSQRQCQFLYQLEFVMENIHASSSIEINSFV